VPAISADCGFKAFGCPEPDLHGDNHYRLATAAFVAGPYNSTREACGWILRPAGSAVFQRRRLC